MWQDITIAIISVILNIALVAQIIYGFKAKRKTVACSTSLITFIGIYISAFIYFNLHLYLIAITGLIGGTFWLILFIQSIKYKK
ncbi:MAG: hypothetical protein AABX99_02470 [Nanoarchaeota archaeon]